MVSPMVIDSMVVPIMMTVIACRLLWVTQDSWPYAYISLIMQRVVV